MVDKSSFKNSFFSYLMITLAIVSLTIIAFNIVQISKLRDLTNIAAKIANNPNVATNQDTEMAAQTFAQTESSGPSSSPEAKSDSLALDIIPKGTPDIYGKELGVSYDDVSSSNPKKADSTIKKLGALDLQISLKDEDLRRYIDTASQISCEYCCGVESIIFSNGKAACSCQHSFAMRGLAKYLIKNHGDEYTNNEILEELGKWKTLFFPSIMAKKATVLKDKGIELNYINLASNKYRGVENED